jgi:hypothetical protein
MRSSHIVFVFVEVVWAYSVLVKVEESALASKADRRLAVVSGGKCEMDLEGLRK